MFSFYTELKVSITVSGLVEIWEIGFVSKINWQTKYISQNQRYVYRKIHFDITQLSMQPDGTLLLAKSKFSISKIWRKKKKRVRWLMWAIPLCCLNPISQIWKNKHRTKNNCATGHPQRNSLYSQQIYFLHTLSIILLYWIPNII